MSEKSSVDWTRRDFVKVGTIAGAGAVAAAGLSGTARAANGSISSSKYISNTSNQVNFAPALSADRKRMAFVAGSMERHGLYEGPVLSGSEQPKLLVAPTADDASLIHSVAYARGGDRIAFMRQVINKARGSGRLSIEEYELGTEAPTEVLRLAEINNGVTDDDLFATRLSDLAYTKDDLELLFHSPKLGLLALEIKTGETRVVVAKAGAMVGVGTASNGSVEYLRDTTKSDVWEHVEQDATKAGTSGVRSVTAINQADCLQFRHVAFMDISQAAFSARVDDQTHVMVWHDLVTGGKISTPALEGSTYLRPGAFVGSSTLLIEQIKLAGGPTGASVKLATWER